MMATNNKPGNSEQNRMRARYRAHCSVEVLRFGRAGDSRPDRREGRREKRTEHGIDYDFYLSD